MPLLSQAYDFASKLTDETRDPREVFKKAGITPENIKTLKNLVNLPVAGNLLGNKKEAILAGANAAEKMLDNLVFSLPEQAPVSEIERLQASLEQLK